VSDGFLLLDKPAGPTSHDMVGAVRRALGVRRVGHAGTLDPFASGLLVMVVGRATRLARFLVGLTKAYEGEIALGAETDTDDVTGVLIRTSDAWRDVSDAALREAMGTFVGEHTQRPPGFSAKHVGGVRAYRLARGGAAPVLESRAVEVRAFAMTERHADRVRFRAEVGSGTYVRALARDLGARVGCGAYLASLRRTRVGTFNVTDAVRPEAVAGATVLDPVAAVSHLPTLELDAEQREEIVHGRPLRHAIVEGEVALVHEGSLVAVAVGAGETLKPRVVMEG